ncbi:MAG: CoA transferase [Deltaproteobacteria bacterium]|nr:CoA transferase [Deltaproteobacteria bacterium]MBW2382254.1 CoA transferase [Deltaproteobacteria bacterium]MBW2697025.1 CoA transferase [Deltaproteobacteria bacterium]
MPGALDGYRIIDLSQVISGPLATRILADQGADVIKVEPPSGDILRHMGGISGLSPTFTTTNRSKRSVVLDLKKPEALETLRRLVKGADVFIQNSRPGTAERIGIGEKALREINPKLIYVSICGFGEEGPYAHKRVYDPLVQGMSTLTEIQGGPAGRPSLVRIIVPDKVTALTASQSITAALLARERTGEGQHVRLSMLDAVIAFVWPEGMAYHTFVSPDLPRPKPVARRDLVYETLDGYVVASTVARREFEGFCRAVGKPEWLEDPRFKDAAGMVKNAKERLEMMAEVLATNTTEHWLEVLDAEDVPCAPVLTRDDVHLHPQVQANGIIVEDEHPVVGRVRQARPPERMDGTPSAITRPAPTIGQHTEEVLVELGLTSAEISKLRELGALGTLA